MKNPSTFIGQCSKGHDVYVTRDLNGDIDGGTIGADVVKPFSDGVSAEPIVMACEACTKAVHGRIASGI